MGTARGGLLAGVAASDAGGQQQDEAVRRGWRDRVARADHWLLATLVLGAGLRLWGLRAQSLWYDEWLTAEAASGSLGHLRSYVTDMAGIPPTYFGVVWVWARVVGDGDAALRSLPVLAGVATIPVAYAAVRDLGLAGRSPGWPPCSWPFTPR